MYKIRFGIFLQKKNKNKRKEKMKNKSQLKFAINSQLQLIY